MREAQRIFDEHVGVSRAVSQENSNLNHNNVDSNSLCLRDVCECFSKSTNIEVNTNSCLLNNCKNKDTMLSSKYGQSNVEYFPTKNWNLYSEANLKCSHPGGQMMSQNESVLLSSSALKAKPDKYKFPKHDPPAMEGLSVYTPKDIYLYILNLVYHRLTPETYNLWCQLTERDVSFPEMSKQGVLETSYSLKSQREKYKKDKDKED